MKEKKLYLLTIGSLVALAAFLTYWLSVNYQEEKGILKDQLENAIAQVNEEINERERKNIFLFISDTARLKTAIVQDTFIENDNPHASISVRRNTNLSAAGIKFTVDTIASENVPFVEFSGTSSFRDTTIITSLFTYGEQEVELLDSLLPIILEEKDLDVSYEILDTIYAEQSGISINVKEADFFSKNTYNALFTEYRPYLLVRIFPEALLSLGLLLLIAASFFLAHKNIQDQRRLGKIKNDFISNMTHELKTPISTVGVAIEAMQNFGALSSPQKTSEYLEIVDSELDRLSILVDKVLKMSQFDSKDAPLGKMTTLDFKSILDNVSKSMKLQLEKYEASLSLKVEGDSFDIMGDKVHVANIIYNLLDNALKYGGDKPKVEVALKEGIQSIMLSVKDHGIGIAKEFQDKVFDQFFRVPTGNVHDVKGYGLGLSYVAGVVKAHGGQISITSVENKGTTFQIELPKHG